MLPGALASNHYFELEHKINEPTDRYNQPLLHCHQYYEIFFSRGDDVTYLVNNNQYTLNRNDMVVLHSNDLHRAVPAPNTRYERYVVYFDPRFVSALNTEQENLLGCFEMRSQMFQHKVHLSDQEADAFVAILDQAPSTTFPRIWQKMVLSQILIFVNEKYKEMLSDHQYIEESEIFQKIKPAIHYINANLSEPLLLDDLASLCFMEKSYFCKTFKRSTGFTPHEYICYKRVIAAEAFLLQGKSVLEVSALVGYKSSTHFSTKFKDYWGISPKAVKRKSL